MCKTAGCCGEASSTDNNESEADLRSLGKNRSLLYLSWRYASGMLVREKTCLSEIRRYLPAPCVITSRGMLAPYAAASLLSIWCSCDSDISHNVWELKKSGDTMELLTQFINCARGHLTWVATYLWYGADIIVTAFCLWWIFGQSVALSSMVLPTGV